VKLLLLFLKCQRKILLEHLVQFIHNFDFLLAFSCLSLLLQICYKTFCKGIERYVIKGLGFQASIYLLDILGFIKHPVSRYGLSTEKIRRRSKSYTATAITAAVNFMFIPIIFHLFSSHEQRAHL